MEQGGMRVEDFIYAIKKRYKMILVIIVFVGISSLALFGRGTTIKSNDEVKIEYEINSKIYIYNAREKVQNDENKQIQGIDARSMNSFSEVLKSRTFMKSVLDEAKSNININTLNQTFWVIVIPDSQVIKLAIIGNDKEELIKVLEQFQNKVIQTAPLIIGNSEAKVIEEIGVVGATELVRTKPKNNNKIAVIMGLTIFASFMLAFLLEYLDNTIKNGKDIEEQFKIPVLGKLLKNNEEKEYIKIRTCIKYSSFNIMNKVVAVTNVDKVKNTNNISKKLVVSLARIEYKTLIITSELGNNNSKDLLHYLDGRESLDDIIEIENEYLDSISLGDIRNGNIDLLDSKLMDNFISGLKLRYECIIIEASSLNSSEVSQILVAKADSVILLAKANKTKNLIFEKSLSLIKNLNTDVIGVILN
ncbi:hypothetical protein [Clostridium gasigenes]|uniref:hypothetical protein n=1 Tax=Clostridium gasigenes TaxID=94869 RepID=UPI001C0E61CA|nr:hypothetical protein [Clostridium gasigenes]MBU3108866.1 hypothetical protein [Clostridium gasigenes]